MNYSENSDGRIKRRKVSHGDLEKIPLQSNTVANPYVNNNKINRKEIDEDFEIEKELFYKNRYKKRKKRNKLIKKSLSLLLTIMLIGTVLASAFVMIALKGTPTVTKDLIYNNYISENIVPIDEIPDNLKNAIIATEDRRFYEHGGIDIRSLMRSVVNNVLSDSTQGGSTIDMQVSKNLLTSTDKTMKRKVVDMYNAIQMNKIMTKDEILSAYLNNIYFGKGSYGVENAAQTYFGKHVRDLNLAQCAMIAGITNNPEKYKQHDEAKRRQKVVLENMYEQGYITKDEYREAVNDPTPFKSEIA